jgi:hypothetical protein
MEGAFEREVRSMLMRTNFWIRSHERFTWINLLLSLLPSPFTAVAGIVLAGLQLSFVYRNKIPSSEKTLIAAALVIGCINLALSCLWLFVVATKAVSIWQLLSPFWFLDWLKQWLHPDARHFKSV